MHRVVFSVFAAAVMCLSSAGAGARTVASKQRFAADGWSLTVHHDAFAEHSHCELRATDKHILYQPNALGFAFRRSRDTLGAWYRIDDHAPVRWENDYPKLIALGAAIDGGGLDNPTGGIVWIPSDEIAGANSVRIRASGNGKGRVFRLTGFSRMWDAAHRLGCVSDVSFEG